MRLIRALEIVDYRSIGYLRLKGIDAYTPVVGINSAGKSNVFRALDHLFNDQPGSARLSLERDFHRPTRRRQKAVQVGVELVLPEAFGLRDPLQAALDAMGADREIAIARRWTLEDPLLDAVSERLLVGPDLDQMIECPPEHERGVRLILNAIHYRYVPNSSSPDALLAHEENQLRQLLLKRVKGTKAYGSAEIKTVMDTFRTISSEMLKPVVERAGQAGPHIKDVRFDLPERFDDLPFSIDVQIRSILEDDLGFGVQGSGTQAFLFFHLLDYIDKAVFGVRFGWLQGSVWAIEEPESYLHGHLQLQLASDLNSMAVEPRRQVFVSTHSEVFCRNASRVALLDLSNGVTTGRTLPTAQAMDDSHRLGSSLPLNPLLTHGGDPLLITEGKLDRLHLERAARLLGIFTPWTVVDLEALQPGLGGGKNQIASYLNMNRPAIRSRLPNAPICVMLDPDVKQRDIDAIEQILTDEHAASRTLVIPEDLTNPKLHRSFGGIERLLSTSIIEEAGSRGILQLLTDAGGKLQVRKEQFGSAEKQGVDMLAGERGDATDYQFFRPLFEWLTLEYMDSGQRLL